MTQGGEQREHALRILFRPFLGVLVVESSVGLVLLGDLGIQRVVGVGLDEKRADRLQRLEHRQRGRPPGSVLQDVDADTTLIVHVAVINFGHKLNLGRLKRVVLREGARQDKSAAFVRRAGRTLHRHRPVSTDRRCTAQNNEEE